MTNSPDQRALREKIEALMIAEAPGHWLNGDFSLFRERVINALLDLLPLSASWSEESAARALFERSVVITYMKSAYSVATFAQWAESVGQDYAEREWLNRRDYYLELTKALPSPLAAWRPISEAPRDGTEVLVRPGDGLTTAEVGHWFAGDSNDGPGWWNTCGTFIHPAPTHWMPLPPPPAKSKEPERP